MKLDFSNVQELIFKDFEAQKLMPKFKDLFQQWKLGQFVPGLRPMAQKALLDLLNQLEEEDIRILEIYLGTTISVEKLDYTLVKTHKVELSNAQEKVECLDLEGELFLYRDANYLYIGDWK
jgi:hypothetical protein